MDAVTIALTKKAIRDALAGGKTRLGPNWVLDGDSITIGSVVTSAGVQGRGVAWGSSFEAMADGRVRVVLNAAVAGQRSDEALARFDSVVAPLRPNVVLLTVGTNNIIQGGSISSWQADLRAYLAKCRAINATLVVGAIWPSHDINPAGHQATNRMWNDWLYEWCASEGLTVIPWDNLTDPVGGGWPSGWTSDGLHPAGSAAAAAIAAFLLTTVSEQLPPPTARLATKNGADLLANGFLTSLGSAMAAPASVTLTPSTASGSLVAGTYEYKVATRALYGEGVKSASASATLTAAGQIVVTVPTGSPSGNKGFSVYRKGPGDSAFIYLASIAAGSYSLTDDGSLVADVTDTGPVQDTSRVPSGLNPGGTTRYKRGGGLLAGVPGFRGNVFRVTGVDSAATQTGDYIGVAVTAGDVLEVTLKTQAHGGLTAQPILRFFNGASTAGTAILLNAADPRDEIMLCRLRFVVPAGVTTVRIGLETLGSVTGGYVDYGEVGLRKIA